MWTFTVISYHANYDKLSANMAAVLHGRESCPCYLLVKIMPRLVARNAQYRKEYIRKKRTSPQTLLLWFCNLDSVPCSRDEVPTTDMPQQSAYIHSKWRLRATSPYHLSIESTFSFTQSPGDTPPGSNSQGEDHSFLEGTVSPYATFALKAVCLLQFKRDILSWLSLKILDTGDSVKCMGMYKPLLTVKVKRGGIIHRHGRPDSTLISLAKYVLYHHWNIGRLLISIDSDNDARLPVAAHISRNLCTACGDRLDLPNTSVAATPDHSNMRELEIGANHKP